MDDFILRPIYGCNDLIDFSYVVCCRLFKINKCFQEMMKYNSHFLLYLTYFSEQIPRIFATGFVESAVFLSDINLLPQRNTGSKYPVISMGRQLTPIPRTLQTKTDQVERRVFRKDQVIGYV